jgi:hypothetical protein
VILETKLHLDYYHETTADSLANRTFAIAMNRRFIRVFILEAACDATGKEPVKTHHNLYKVDGIARFLTEDVSRLIALLLVRLNADLWSLANPSAQSLQNKYKGKVLDIATPKKANKRDRVRECPSGDQTTQ